jgi:hypothetical protein
MTAQMERVLQDLEEVIDVVLEEASEKTAWIASHIVTQIAVLIGETRSSHLTPRAFCARYDALRREIDAAATLH